MNTRLVAILNVTPDSFSDGGRHMEADQALAAAQGFIADGASVLDVGAESTRPGAQILTPDEEWRRLAPALEAVSMPCTLNKIPLSVDTRHAETAMRALKAGADWINDVSGFTNSAMVSAIADSNCKLVVMHSLTVPADPKVTLPAEADPMTEILRFGEMRIAALRKQGINRERIVFDPGIGFGKTAEQSVTLLRRITELRNLGVPLLVGHSRKSFLSAFVTRPVAERDALTLAVSCHLAAQGVDYLRVHAIAMHADALRATRALV